MKRTRARPTARRAVSVTGTRVVVFRGGPRDGRVERLLRAAVRAERWVPALRRLAVYDDAGRDEPVDVTEDLRGGPRTRTTSAAVLSFSGYRHLP